MSIEELKEEKQEEPLNTSNPLADNLMNNERDTLSTRKKNKVKRFLRGIGLGFLYVSGTWFSCLLGVVCLIFMAGAVIAVIGFAISLIISGSIFLGIIVLLIGTPIALALASYLFPFWLFLATISGIIWLVVKIFSLDISFENIMDSVWRIVSFCIYLFFTFWLAKGFIEAFKTKSVKSFLKETWFYILLFFLFLWILF